MRKKKSNFRFGMVVLAFLFIYCAYTALGQQNLLHAKRVELQKMDGKLKDEQKANDELKQQQQEINSDAYLEQIAREKLGMVKPGEKVYVDVGK